MATFALIIFYVFVHLKQFELFPLRYSEVDVNPLKLVTRVFNHIFATYAFTRITLDIEYGIFALFVASQVFSISFSYNVDMIYLMFLKSRSP